MMDVKSGARMLLMVMFAAASAVVLPIAPTPASAVPVADGVALWGVTGFGLAPSVPAGAAVSAIAAGSFYEVVAFDDGSVVSAGSAAYGQVPPPPAGSHYVSIALSGTPMHGGASYPYFGVALASDGSITQWGQIDSNVFPPPVAPSGRTFVAMDAGSAFAVALLDDGSAVTWGPDAYLAPVPTPPPGVRYTGVSAGNDFVVAVRSDGLAEVWGGSYYPGAAPPPPTGTKFTKVAAGNAHAIGLLDSGRVIGWGYNGDGSASAPLPPLGERFVDVDAGAYFSVALTSAGRFQGWGANYCQATSGPVLPVGVGLVTLVAGRCGGIALTGPIQNPPIVGRQLQVWGSNAGGQLGVGGVLNSTDPVRVSPQDEWISLTAGFNHTCAIKTDRSLWCWGSNDAGQLGDGTTTTRDLPSRVGSDNDWTLVSAGGRHTCGVKLDATLWCWGANSSGQVGNSSWSDEYLPVKVGATQSWHSVSTGWIHTCAIGTNATLWCWGDNGWGELGLGDQTARVVPVQLGGGSGWETVSANWVYTCATRADGTLWCWGFNGAGQLGDGTTLDRHLPNLVGVSMNWTSVSTGSYHTCGLQSDGSMWCWGNNSGGELGVGDQLGRLTPSRVGVQTDWSSVSSGDFHTCGLRSDGTLWCWGSNQLGQLGDGTTTDRLEPVQIGASTQWTQVETRHRHTVALSARPIKFDLLITVVGTGHGVVSAASGTVNCDATCSAQLNNGETVSLVAIADFSSEFVGWSGACSGVGSCTVTADAAKSVSATFTLKRHPITAVLTGTGAGAVISVTGGIDCGTSCSAAFDHGSTVILEAVPAASSDFAGWSGAGCSGVGSCVVSLTAAASVTATFNLKTYPVTVSRTGAGSGTITSSPAGISCRTACSTSVTHGSTVTLTAVAAAGSTFTGWSGGGCTGTGTCTVTVTAATSVSASFVPVPTLSAVAPATGGRGVSVTLTGANLSGATAVTFNGVAAPFTVLSNTSIVTSVPVGATTGPIRVVTPGGTATSANFTVSPSTFLPTVTSYSPTLVRPGAATQVILTGTNLAGATSVTLNGVSLAPVTVLSATSLQVTVPSSGVSSGAVRVTTAGGVSTNTIVLIVNAAPTQVSAGASHTCARHADGTASCWGLNTNGKVGDGTTTQRATPVTVLTATAASLTGVVEVSAGSAHSCAVLSSGLVRCWGANTNGQLGTGSTTSLSFASTNVAAITNATQVSAGASHSCARLADGTARCWGVNTNGRLGDGTTTQRNSPVTVLSAAGVPLTGVVSISAGATHTCAVLNTGAIRCWGANTNGQLGTGSTTSLSFASTDVAAITNATQVSAGASHSCARLADGTARCWGVNTNGRLGDGTTTQRTTPVAVLQAAGFALSGVSSISAGGAHTCAMLAAGAVRCWGNNLNGQLGTGSTTSLSYASANASSVTSAVQVSAGRSHTAVVASSATLNSVLQTTGLNTNGQLGDGSVTQHTAPALVLL